MQLVYLRSYFKFKLILLFIMQTFRYTTYSMMNILANCLLSEIGLRVYLMHFSYDIHLFGIFINIFLNEFSTKLLMKFKRKLKSLSQANTGTK